MADSKDLFTTVEPYGLPDEIQYTSPTGRDLERLTLTWKSHPGIQVRIIATESSPTFAVVLRDCSPPHSATFPRIQREDINTIPDFIQQWVRDGSFESGYASARRETFVNMVCRGDL